jgi:hypothetical protein
MQFPDDEEFLPIAKLGLMTPVEYPWQVVKDDNDNI